MTTKQHGSVTLNSCRVGPDSKLWGFGWAPESAVIQVEHELTAQDVWQRYSRASELMDGEELRFIVEYDGEPVETFDDGLKAAEALATGKQVSVEVWIPSKDPSSPWQQMKSEWGETEGDRHE